MKTVARTVAGNTLANVTRLAVTSLVSIFLPAYLTHQLPVKTYGAWVLILQLSAYVNYLDFGVQTAVSKYIAEYRAKQDERGCSACASAGFAIMLVASGLGALLTLVLVWRVPVIFRTMPVSFFPDVRRAVLFVGLSLSISLATSVFVAIFLGLQRYRIPMMTTIANRLAFGVVMCAAATTHASLATMGALAACVNILTAVLQVAMWRRNASHIRVSIHVIDVGLLKGMLRYCSVLLIWSLSAMLISGLDLTVVGHYSFSETAYYAIANAPVAFLLLIVSALMGPVLPAASAQSVGSSPAAMGQFLSISTRLSMVGLLLTGLPFLVVGHLILRVWVGPVYAQHSTPFLHILIVANIIRSSCAPFSTIVLATGQQKVATASPVTEGIINLVASVWLVQHLGALGVALGTLIGACAGVAVHFAVSMRFTQSRIGIAPGDLFLQGMLRPSALALPSIPFLWSGMPTSPFVYCVWGAATLLIAWFTALTREEREQLIRKWQPLPERQVELVGSALAGEAGE